MENQDNSLQAALIQDSDEKSSIPKCDLEGLILDSLDHIETKDPAKTSKRYYFLFLSSVIGIGSYFAHDNPAVLITNLKESMGLNDLEYNMLYSFYSFPNCFLPILGGIFMDGFGVRVFIYISSGLVTIGQAIFAFGITFSSFYTTLLGRVVLGCGGINLEIGQCAIVVGWFSGKELSMAFGLNSMLSFLGILLNDNIMPVLVYYTNLEVGF